MVSRFAKPRKFEKDLRIKQSFIHLLITHFTSFHMSAQNSFGTVHTEAFFANLGSFATTLGVALEDKKLTAMEGVSLAIALAPFGESVKSFKGLTIPEIKNIYANEVARVSQSFASRFDIPNDNAEAFIEDCITFALAGVALYNSASNLFAQ